MSLTEALYTLFITTVKFFDSEKGIIHEVKDPWNETKQTIGMA